jgi:hypothetical protein
MWDQRGPDPRKKKANMGPRLVEDEAGLDAGGGMSKGFWVWKEVLGEMRALSRNWEEKIRDGVELHVWEFNYVNMRDWKSGIRKRRSLLAMREV